MGGLTIHIAAELITGIDRVILLTPDGQGGANETEITFGVGDPITVSEVPLPSTLLLFGSGLIGLAMKKRTVG